MKPVNQALRHKQKGWVPVSTFAMVKEMPTAMQYQEHLIPFEGADGDTNLPWGVYGSASTNSGMFLAEAAARKAKKPLVLVGTLWYFIEDFSAAGELRKSMEDGNGFLHLGRISASLRDEIRAELMQILEEQQTVTAARKKQLEEMSWEDFLVKVPGVVREFIRRGDDLMFVVHPVRQLYDKDTRPVLWVASFKMDPERVMAAEVRHMPQIELII